jgi:hypothetical protein
VLLLLATSASKGLLSGSAAAKLLGGAFAPLAASAKDVEALVGEPGLKGLGPLPPLLPKSGPEPPRMPEICMRKGTCSRYLSINELVRREHVAKETAITTATIFQQIAAAYSRMWP